MVETTFTPYGRPASLALAGAILDAKAGAALAPVTVVVPSNFAGLAARRLLGSGELNVGGRPVRGVANVNFFTAFRLADLLAAGRLGGRRPLTAPVLHAAVRHVLADDPGRFASVADHTATEAVLARAVGELANLEPTDRRRLAATGPMAADAVRVHDAVAAELVDFHDEADVVRAATGRPDLAEALAPFGPLVWYLPAPVTPPLERLLAAVLPVADRSQAIVGRTGDPTADRRVDDVVAAVGLAVDRPTVVETPGPSAVLSTSDADEEGRAAVRRVVELAEAGTPLDRIGVFYAATDPYLRILHQQFAAADLPVNGPSGVRLSASVAGRTLLAALELPARRWRRDRVMALVSSGPIRSGDRPVRPATWELLSRDAGVVAGRADWTAKLARRRGIAVAALDHVSSGGARTAIERTITDLDELDGFVRSLAEHLDDVAAATSWATRAEAVGSLLRHLLGSTTHRATWPEAEAEAFDRVEAAVIRLGTLDDVDPDGDLDAFRRALANELDVGRGRVGRFGQGVTIGPLTGSVGHDLDAVVVVGAVEGLLPTVQRDDPLLADTARAAVGRSLTRRGDRQEDQYRAYLAVLAAAPEDARTVTHARGDLRSHRRLLPSRHLVDGVAARLGRPVRAELLDSVEDPLVAIVPSFVAGLRLDPLPGVVERDLRAIGGHVAIGGDPADHPAASDVRRGIEAQQARASDAFTEWDGNVAGAVASAVTDRAQSPTRLESWASCGFRFFLGYVLGVGGRDDPERLTDLSALDRGSGLHEILERFIGEVVASDAVPSPDEPWSEAQLERLQAIAGEVLDGYEAAGRTGRDIAWAITRADILRLLDQFAFRDQQIRGDRRLRPESVELAFGLDGADPLRIDVGGRTLAFRGRIDRIDRDLHGAATVFDYKTGKGSRYEALSDDPVGAGTILQLGIYAEAMRAAGEPDPSAFFWMVNGAAKRPLYGSRWDDTHRDRLLDTLGVIADGIEAGEFAPVPGEWVQFRGTHQNCVYCEFDSVCRSARGEEAEAKEAELVFRPRLVRPDPSDTDGDETAGTDATGDPT